MLKSNDFKRKWNSYIHVQQSSTYKHLKYLKNHQPRKPLNILTRTFSTFRAANPLKKASLSSQLENPSIIRQPQILITSHR